MIKKILCPGEILIDFINENKDGETFVKKFGGAPANVAITLAKLGDKSYFYGSVGKDKFGEYLLHKLTLDSVETKYVSRVNKHTTMAFVYLDEESDRSFEFSRGSDKILEKIEVEELKTFEHIHFGSAMFLLDDLFNDYYAMLESAVSFNISTSFDPNYRSFLVKDETLFKNRALKFIEKSTIVKLSSEEAELLSGKDSIEGARELSKLGCDILILTLGVEGCIVFIGEEEYKIPSIKVNAVDTTGAGDAFIAAFIHKYLQDKTTIIENTSFANKIGALTTTVYGATAVSLSEIKL